LRNIAPGGEADRRHFAKQYLILTSNKRSTWNIYKKLPSLTRSLPSGQAQIR
jgi:hypothetical protein